MSAAVDLTTTWTPDTRILRTALKGAVTEADVERWRDGLHAEAARLPSGVRFRLLLDLHGFEPASLGAHKAMRTVVPELMAAHGLRPAFIDLFDEKPELPIAPSPDAICAAFANVHHDEGKMENYRRRIGCENQQFFTDAEEAERWLALVG